MRRNLHKSVGDCNVGEYGRQPIGVAAVGKVGGCKSRVGRVVGKVKLADVEGQLDLALEVEFLRYGMLKMACRGSGRVGREEWGNSRRLGAKALVGIEGGVGIRR